MSLKKNKRKINKKISSESLSKQKQEAEKIGIELYLGTEQHVNSMTVDYIEAGRCHTLADTPYVLAEYKYETDFSYNSYAGGCVLFAGCRAFQS